MGGQHHNDAPEGAQRGAVDEVAARERRIGAIAARQHADITRAQLRAAGLGSDAIDRRLRVGTLHRLHRAVYLLGPPLPREWSYEMAAVLACGAGTVLGDLSAAYLWRYLPHPRNPRPVSVIVPGRDPGRKPGIRIHRVKSLDARETRTRFNIPVTSPARTLLDLAATHPAHVEQALGEAYAKRLATAKELLSLLDRHPRHRGTRALRALVEADRAPARLRSEAEARLLALIRKAGLPEPEVNVREGPYVLDFLWRAHRLVVEVDGFAFHSSRAAFERDRCRDADLVARGLRVIRVTWRQIIDEPEAILVRLAQALARV